MPYVQYLYSAQTQAYTLATFSKSSNYTGVYTGNLTASAGLYGSASSQSGTYYNPPAGSESPASASGAELNFEVNGTTYSDSSYTASGATISAYNGNDEDNNGNKGMQSFRTFQSYTASGSWDGTQITGEGSSTYRTSFTTGLTNATGGVGGSASSGETVNAVNAGIRDHFFDQTTITTSSSVNIRKTTETEGTYYGPLEDSTTEYTSIIDTLMAHTFTGIKTLTNSKFYWDLEFQSRSYKIEWLGYAGSGGQYLGLVYTTTAINKDISDYVSVLMETDSFSSTEENESFAYETYFTDSLDEDTYTLTYDVITTSGVASQTTTLERQTLSVINSFAYGFIKTNTADTTIYTAGKSIQTVEQVSSDRASPFILDSTGIFLGSGVSYSYIQAITTTSDFTQFVEISGLNKAQSFAVRRLVSTTASYTARANSYAVTANNDLSPNGNSFSFAPAFVISSLTLRSPETSNPDTYYTEAASFASFADPSYTSAFTNYSPADCSLVFLALLALEDTAEEGKYPSYISVYNGSVYLNADRAQSSLSSVTLFQSSSYVGTGSTNVFQTINYFIGNNTSSATTTTTSIAMVLQGNASSVSRLIRTKAENLDSAYYNSYLPAILLVGNDVVYNQGLQGTAGYNIDGRLMNAYTTANSTFAGFQTSSFPISTSTMPYQSPRKNKIRIDKGYDVFPQANTFQIELLRYSFHNEG